MHSPSNCSASNLPFGLPPHVSTFFPKSESVNGSTGHPSQENAETRAIDNKRQECHSQEHHHSGRYFDTSNQVAAYENTSQSCQYVPEDGVSTNGNNGTKQREVEVYLCDPRLSRKNGGQGFHSPHPISHPDWIKRGQGSQMTSDSWSKQVQEKPFVPPLPSSPSLTPLTPPSLLPTHSPSQEPVPALPISEPAGHLETKWKPKIASCQILQQETDTVSSVLNNLSTGRIPRDHSTPMIPCLLSLPFPVYCFNCHEVGHEARQCSIGNSVKQPKKRKSDESQGCCKHTKKGNHDIDCPSLASVTQEIGSSAEKPSVSRWATGANAVPQLVGGKTPVVRISVDNNPVAAGSSTMEETLQESFVIQKNIANATFSVESKSVINEADIDELLASARLAGSRKADTLSSEKSDSSVSKTILIPNYAERNVGNTNPCLPSITSAEGSSGTKDDQKGNEKEKTGKNNNADIQICNLCRKKKGGHVQGCLNSKNGRILKNLEKRLSEKLPKKIRKEEKKWAIFSEILNKMKSDGIFPPMPVERPPQQRRKKSLEEQQVLERVELIKRVPREELEEIVLRHVYACDANKCSKAELDKAEDEILNLRKHILITKINNQKGKKKAKPTPMQTRSIGIQVESLHCATSGQQNIPLTVECLPPVHVKLERSEPPSPELSTSKKGISNGPPPSIGNSGVAQLPCDPIVSSTNTTNERIVKIEKQCMPILRDNSLHTENNREHQETTATPHIQLPLQEAIFTNAKSALNVKNNVPSLLGHPPKQFPVSADPINPSAKYYQSSKERPTNTTTGRIVRHLEQQRASSSSTLGELSSTSAGITRQRQQPSAASNSYQQPYVCTNGIQQKSQRIENVQSDFRPIKLENIKIEANKPREVIIIPIQRSNVHALGSRELPIQIE